jgi:hypothetical protein
LRTAGSASAGFPLPNVGAGAGVDLDRVPNIGLRRVEAETLHSLERVVLGGGQVVDFVELAGAQRGDGGVGVAEVLDDQRLVGGRSRVVVLVGGEGRVLVAHVAGKGPGTVADDGEARHVAEVREVLDLARPHVLRDDRDECRLIGDVGLGRRRLDRQRGGVRRGDALEVGDERAVHGARRRILHDEVVGPGDIRGGQRLAVGPLEAAPDRERPREMVRRDGPLRGQVRLRVAVLAGLREERVDRVDDLLVPRVVGEERVERRERRIRLDPQRGSGRGGGCCRRGDHGERRDGHHGHCEQAAPNGFAVRVTPLAGVTRLHTRNVRPRS